MARVLDAEGDIDGALELVGEASRIYTGDFSPNVRPVPALRARMLAAHGRLDQALEWVRQSGVSADDELSYLREYEHITLARVFIAQHRTKGSLSALRSAIDLLARLLPAAEHGERTGSLIEILILQALAQDAIGERTVAIDAVERAVLLAEPEGYVRVFAGEGHAMAALLSRTRQRDAVYVRRLVDACAPHTPRSPESGPARTPVADHLVDPLSERELQVLRLLGTDLDGPDIARHLMVSLNTLRTHTKNIYAKLGVNSRRAAVRRAGELNLFSADRDR